jgi:hypothetical protein
MSETKGILDVGQHTVSASWKALDANNTNGFRVLFMRLNSGMSDVNWGVKDVNGEFKEGPHLQADESWTFGPNAGTIYTTEIFIKGTAGDSMTYGGAKS